MNRKIRRQLTNQPADTHVLHNGRIDAGCDDRPQIFLGGRQLVREHQRVERNVTANPAPVQKLHQLRQRCLREIVRAHPGVEPVETKIDGVSPILDRRPRTFPITSRREQLGQTSANSLGDDTCRSGL